MVVIRWLGAAACFWILSCVINNLLFPLVCMFSKVLGVTGSAALAGMGFATVAVMFAFAVMFAGAVVVSAAATFFAVRVATRLLPVPQQILALRAVLALSVVQLAISGFQALGNLGSVPADALMYTGAVCGSLLALMRHRNRWTWFGRVDSVADDNLAALRSYTPR